jgi:hypothetical protein
MTAPEKPQPFFKPWQTTLLVVVLFCAALGIRLYDLTDLPNDFYMVRQYRGLLMARGMYYAGLENAEEWQRQVAISQWQSESLIEPPILEGLVALTYRVIGEHIWVGRVFSSLFWLAGGLALLLLAKDLSMRMGGLIGLAYYLVLPFGVIASRTFMPDPLMTALMVWSVWALHRWEMHRTWKTAILAGMLTGLAILVKSVIVFPLLGAAAGLLLSRNSFRKMILDWQTWAVAGATALPTVIYYIYGLFIEGSLGGQFSLRFFPDLLTDPSFYARWLFMMAGFGGFLALFLAWIGILFFRTRATRFLVIGLWIGYIIYGLVFPYHFLTHDYYHLPLIPIIAIGLIPSAEIFIEQIGRLTVNSGADRSTGWGRAALVGLLLFAVAMKMWESRNTMARDGYRHEVAYWQELGQVIGHDKNIIELAGDYGVRLAYFGWVSGRQWPMTADVYLRTLAGQDQPDFSETFAEQTEGMDLFVVTSLPELENQPELGQYLSVHYPLIAEGDGYLIYDLKP